jgi:hypothetical protein
MEVIGPRMKDDCGYGAFITREASTRVVVSRRFDWMAASIGRIVFLSSMKSPRCESSSSPTRGFQR